MQAQKFTKDVHYKFDEKGNFLPFLGATIISPMAKNEAIYQEVLKISRENQNTSYAHHFAFLPEPSYHMTNFVLYNDNEEDRNGAGWSSKFDNKTPFEEMNALICNAIKKVKFPTSYKMKLQEVRGNSLWIVPADDKTKDSLSIFRDQIAQATGIYWPDHKTYKFHISYAYYISELNDEEKKEEKQLLVEQTSALISNLPEFDIGAPVYCSFKDMSSFQPYPSL